MDCFGKGVAIIGVQLVILPRMSLCIVVVLHVLVGRP